MDTLEISDRGAALARIYVGVTTPLLILGLVTLSLRLYVRSRPVLYLGWDDVWIVVGAFLTIILWAMLLCSMNLQAGTYPITRARDSIQISYLAIPIWTCAMATTKAGVALTLIRIWTRQQSQHRRNWVRALRSVLWLQPVTAVGNLLFIFLQCHPLAAAWDGRVLRQPGASCLGLSAVASASITTAAMNVATDVVLSVAPALLMVDLRRPVLEKVLLMVLMGLGILASAASLRKALMVVGVGVSGAEEDPWAFGVSISTWTAIEPLLASMAACSVCLRAVLRRFLAKFGMGFSTTESFTSLVEVPVETKCDEEAIIAGSGSGVGGGSRAALPVSSIGESSQMSQQTVQSQAQVKEMGI